MIQVIRDVRSMRAFVATRKRDGQRVGFVPTMGAFHAGHRSLMQRAAKECDVVVVSLFVNPTQFDDASDLAAYPRDEASDLAQAEAQRVDVLFAPTPAEMYPPGFATTITVAELGETLEGASRGPGHFRGVATVVTKLLNIVQSDVLYLGQKDAQQVSVIRRMVLDLDIPVHVEVCPTMREADGLAMSSRNVRLRGDERVRALALRRGLNAALAAIAAGSRDASEVAAAGRSAMQAAGVEPEYFAIVDPLGLVPQPELTGDVLIAVAARVGPVRLIDNELVHL